jgi:hypothetical protein
LPHLLLQGMIERQLPEDSQILHSGSPPIVPPHSGFQQGVELFADTDAAIVSIIAPAMRTAANLLICLVIFYLFPLVFGRETVLYLL